MKFLPAFFALVILISSQSLMAHTKSASSMPEDGAVVTSLTEIRIEFPAPVRLTAVILENEAGTQFKLSALPQESGTSFPVAIEESLAPGNYLITWRSVSADSHIVSGEIRFSVAS